MFKTISQNIAHQEPHSLSQEKEKKQESKTTSLSYSYQKNNALLRFATHNTTRKKTHSTPTPPYLKNDNAHHYNTKKNSHLIQKKTSSDEYDDYMDMSIKSTSKTDLSQTSMTLPEQSNVPNSSYVPFQRTYTYSEGDNKKRYGSLKPAKHYTTLSLEKEQKKLNVYHENLFNDHEDNDYDMI